MNFTYFTGSCCFPVTVYVSGSVQVTLKQNTTHKTIQTIKDTPHTINTMQIQLQVQQIQFEYKELANSVNF
jgi:hypothetical protein